MTEMSMEREEEEEEVEIAATGDQSEIQSDADMRLQVARALMDMIRTGRAFDDANGVSAVAGAIYAELSGDKDRIGHITSRLFANGIGIAATIDGVPPVGTCVEGVPPNNEAPIRELGGQRVCDHVPSHCS